MIGTLVVQGQEMAVVGVTHRQPVDVACRTDSGDIRHYILSDEMNDLLQYFSVPPTVERVDADAQVRGVLNFTPSWGIRVR